MRRFPIRLRISLKWFLAIVTLFAIFVGRKSHFATVQKNAVVSVRELNGHVRYDWQPSWREEFLGVRSPTSPKPVWEPSGPAWIRKRLGDEYFQRIIEVRLRGNLVNDESLAAVGALPYVKSYIVGSSQLTDDGMAYFGKMPTIDHLVLSGNKITDAGLRHLASVKKLSNLYLAETGITSDGIEVIVRNHPMLRQLVLSRTRVGDASLRAISKLRHLEYLHLVSTDVTDLGLTDLAKCASLRRLNLDFTDVGDAGIKQLRGLKNLEFLALRGTHVTDEGLQHLAELPKLHSVDVVSTRVTMAAVASLHTSCPDLRVETGGWYNPYSKNRNRDESLGK